MNEQVGAREKVARYLGLSKEGSPQTPHLNLPWWVTAILAAVVAVGVVINAAAGMWWLAAFETVAALGLAAIAVQRFRSKLI